MGPMTFHGAPQNQGRGPPEEKSEGRLQPIPLERTSIFERKELESLRGKLFSQQERTTGLPSNKVRTGWLTPSRTSWVNMWLISILRGPISLGRADNLVILMTKDMFSSAVWHSTQARLVLECPRTVKDAFRLLAQGPHGDSVFPLHFTCIALWILGRLIANWVHPLAFLSILMTSRSRPRAGWYFRTSASPCLRLLWELPSTIPHLEKMQSGYQTTDQIRVFLALLLLQDEESCENLEYSLSSSVFFLNETGSKQKWKQVSILHPSQHTLQSAVLPR